MWIEPFDDVLRSGSLSELAHIIRVGVVDGWTDLGDIVKHKLEHWLADSERALRDLPARNR